MPFLSPLKSLKYFYRDMVFNNDLIMKCLSLRHQHKTLVGFENSYDIPTVAYIKQYLLSYT